MLQINSGYLIAGAGAIFLLVLFLKLSVHLIKKTISCHKQPVSTSKEKEGPHTFQNKMIHQIAAQQTDAALGEIAGLLQRKREKINALIFKDTQSIPDMNRVGRQQRMAQPQNILDLNEKGMTEDEICMKLMVPLSEVSLFLRMRKA